MQVFETVSFHIVKPCNFKCKYCYATFDDMHVGPQMSLTDAMTIIEKLASSGVQKITFAGGEPMLYRNLMEVIEFSKKVGLTTSIITNGSLINESFLAQGRGLLDWIGISVDSVEIPTNRFIGRQDKAGKRPDYWLLVDLIRKYEFKLKINTVVNRFNYADNLNSFIAYANPDRWKVFQALRVEGQNDADWDRVKVDDEDFSFFLDNHKTQCSLVPEDNAAMTGSYMLIDPLGRMFENSAGKHTYSDSLIDHSVDHCLNQINLNREMFISRGGIYDWKS